MKYGQQRLIAGRKNYIFFLCPLDGEQFNARTQGKIQYYVTNYRLIVVEGEDISFYTPDDLPPMKIRRYKNGNASILFARRYVGSQGRTYAPVCVLENIKDVAGAQRALNAMLRKESN